MEILQHHSPERDLMPKNFGIIASGGDWLRMNSGEPVAFPTGVKEVLAMFEGSHLPP
jgi:hypothetical protein